MRTTFLQVLKDEDKASSLRWLTSGSSRSAKRIEIDPNRFSAIPGSPFAYWASQSLIEWFSRWSSFRENGYDAMTGAKTNDDMRFIRLAWEVPSEGITTSREGTFAGHRWARITRGGKKSSFYRDIDSVVDWERDGYCLKAYISEYRGSRGWGYQWSANLNGYDWYFREGLTWPLRGSSLSVWPVPRGCLPSGAGKMAYAPLAELPVILAVANSRAFNAAIRVFAGEERVQYEAGLIQQVPFPAIPELARHRLTDLALAGWSARRALDTASEISHAFVLPAALQVSGDSLALRAAHWAEYVERCSIELQRVHSEIDELCLELYGASEQDRQLINAASTESKENGTPASDSDDEGDGESDDDTGPISGDDVERLAAALLSWAVGVAVGRFDIRLATGERSWPAEPDPFDPLPRTALGSLGDEFGYSPREAPRGYPMPLAAVLVEDRGHDLDLAARMRVVFESVFGDEADLWWSEAGEALGNRDSEVEAWLRKTFFDYHLKTYSKSRRKAPILWPIGTRSGSYRVWLYAHRVSADSVFVVLNDIVGPKVHNEEGRLTELRQEAGTSPAASQRKAIDAQETFVAELREFRDELAAVAPLWSPDLNDGVMIVLAPLWRLFGHHRGWSSELKDRWKKLAAGDYDWAHLAMRLWPERVIPKCAEDRSLAIAHGLEDVFWVADKDNPDKWHPRTVPTTPVEELIGARANSTVTTARQHPTP
jgi:hypothetical protein